VDYLGLSFVRRAEDLGELRALVPPDVKLVAKIEKATALEDLGRILEACDAVMVARGDLGVELPFEEVPAVQKRLIREANRYGKPVITATQMLESMVHHPRPTRAEASDVANAILDGTDAVMLSAETAVGEYPFEAVRAMDRIIRETERQGPAMGVGARDERRLTPGETVSVEDAIAIGTSAVARMLKTPLIVTLTSGGFTSRKVAALRTPVPILAVTTQPTTYRQLALVWGVTPVLVDRVPGYDAMLAVVRDLILKRAYARAGDRIVMTAGGPCAGSAGDEQTRARRPTSRARWRSRDRRDAGTRPRPPARRPHGARLPRGTDCVPHRRESHSGGGARPAGGARGAGAERPAAAPAPAASLDPRGRRRGAADRRAAHLPHAPHARNAPRGAGGESAGGRHARLRRTGHRREPGLNSSRGGIARHGERTRSDAATVPEPGRAPERRAGRAGAPGGIRRAGGARAGALADLGDRPAGGGAARVDPRAVPRARSRRSPAVHDARDEHPCPLLRLRARRLPGREAPRRRRPHLRDRAPRARLPPAAPR